MTTDERVHAENLAKPRAGSHRAFRTLVEPHQAELHRHWYRMTGSLDDAEDLVQETLFRAWRGLGRYVSRGSFRAWLYRIATNRTLDLIGSAPRRREIVNSAGEPSWLQPYPTQGEDETGDAVIELEAIGLAFVVAVQHLPGRQRSALLLCDVLGFSAAEAAQILDTSVPARNSLLQRARATMTKIQPLTDVVAPEGDQMLLVERFQAAWAAGDSDALLVLLTESAHLTMPPYQLEFIGRTDVVDLLLDAERFADHTLIEFVPVSASGERGFATYIREPGSAVATRHCVMLFSRAAGTVSKITGFTEDRVFDLLDLPATVETR